MTTTNNNPEKLSPVKVAKNFRDIGGYEAGDGRRIKLGQVFRSSHLSYLSAIERAYLSQLNIKVVCDFRDQSEIKEKPDNLPVDSLIEYLHLPVTHGAFNTDRVTEKIKSGDISWLTDDYMIAGYKKNIDDFAHVWGTVFNRLADPKNRPLVYHCSAGKDRAGTCTALLLLALGVPEQTVIYDYELSNMFLSDWVKDIHEQLKKINVKPDCLAPFLFAPRNYIVSLLDHLKATYGTAENYLVKKAGVQQETLDILKEELLQYFFCSKDCVKTGRIN